MAVEVIGQDESIARKLTCRACGAVLRYYKKDVTSFFSRDPDGGGDTSHSICCPRCKETLAVERWY